MSVVADIASLAREQEVEVVEVPEETRRQPLRERAIPRSWFIAKRSTDVVLAILTLVMTLPILIVAIVGIMASSPGSPFFAQERVGLFGRRFTMFKLRTMRSNAHEHQDMLRSSNDVSGPVFKMKNDPRVFAFGRIIRKLSIDEIPNLVNVLFGQMSLVGPRPPLPSEVEGYSHYALKRLRAKPGVTCVWQISGRSRIEFDEWVRLDNHYIDNWSPLYDFKIILCTIPVVLFGKGAY